MLCSVLLLLAVAVRSCTRRGVKKGRGLLIGESEDDVRDNVLNYDEQGGGEEDEVRIDKHCEIPRRYLHYSSEVSMIYKIWAVCEHEEV